MKTPENSPSYGRVPLRMTVAGNSTYSAWLPLGPRYSRITSLSPSTIDHALIRLHAHESCSHVAQYIFPATDKAVPNPSYTPRAWEYTQGVECFLGIVNAE